ncbi:MAG: adenine phosphoribosyltransferase [Chloroflexi bacterium]|nr:adenine phosphoribosyltransferase [Chloroflexota bacterium]
MNLKDWIRDVPDYPRPGILFRDITPLLSHPPAFRWAIEKLSAPFATQKIDAIAGIDARGFIFGAPVAYVLGVPFVPVRKQDKLPPETIGVDYDLEYGSSRLEARVNALEAGMNVLVVDDLLATGGSAAATGKLISDLHANVIGYSFVIELAFLDGRAALGHDAIEALVQY